MPRFRVFAHDADPSRKGEPGVATVASLARPWNVIVHDDPVTLMTYVTEVFMRVFAYAEPKAHKLMLEVHTTGRSIVWTGARETAEIYVLKLQAFCLLATLEPVES